MGILEQWASETAADWVVIPSKVKLQAIEPAKDIEKANPYHDKYGRFTFAPGGGAGSTLAPKALAKCKEVEAASVKLSNEQLTAIDDDGNIVFQKEGNRAHVSLGYEDRMKADGKILTHNHPGEYGGTFSEGDIGTFLGVYAKSIRAVGAEGTYSIERGKAEYEEVYSFAQASVKELRGIGAQFAKARDGKMADVAAGKISEGDADKELGALRKELLSSMSTKFEQLAKQNNLIYTFEPSGKVEKFNPYHDERGRFTSANGVGGAVAGKGFKGTLYHGSPSKDIEEFDMSLAGRNTSSGEKLLFFTDSKQMAEDFSYERLEGSSAYLYRRGKKGRVYEVDVEMKNPLDFRNLSEKDVDNLLKLNRDGLLTKEIVQDLLCNHQLLKVYLDLRAETLSNLGYDGLIANTGREGYNSLEYAVVDSKQAKIKKSVEDVEKANPYHDPKTGRFTFAPGGSASAGTKCNSYGDELTEEQSKFFAGSQAVDEDGDLMVLHHGTVHEFNEFDTSLANPENDMGQGIYLTSSEQDSWANYGSESGPDLQAKIDRYKEMLEADGMDSDEAEAAAKEMFITAEPNVLDCYVNIQNPVRLGGKKETFFDYDDGYDPDTDDYGDPKGKLLDFYDAVSNAIYEGDFETMGTEDFLESVRSSLFEEAYDGGISATQAIQVVKDASFDHNVLKESSWGDYCYGGAEVARQALENMGYDGIIDNTVSEKFRNMRGMNRDTTHYIVFRSNQVKLIDNENPTDSDDITKGSVLLWATT